ncbi:hypothetical protein CPB85DRAFT_1308922 [Mucidula mucida]|nr:hypothetical protein CPB85DRAFT_1308922 [Mucidula mucida]
MELCTRMPDAIPAVLQRLHTSVVGSEELTHTLFFIYRFALTDILRETLLIGKVTRAISSTVRRMLDAPFNVRSTVATQTALRFFLSYFGSIVTGESKGGCEWIAEALEYQLLYYVREISGQHFHLFPKEHHDKILESILQITLRLQLALIYRPVLKQCTKQFVPRLKFNPQKGNLMAWQSTSAVRVKAKELRKKLSMQEGGRIFDYQVCANGKVYVVSVSSLLESRTPCKYI